MDSSFENQITDENISLFRSVFKGREDVVPEYWKSKRRDKKDGYSPLCKNKWDAELCNLKKKNRDGCKNCDNVNYTPLSDDLIRKHLTGGTIFGIYPLLLDNTCNCIGADFDKHKPTDPDPFGQVKKFIDVCEVQGIRCHVLRSKGGNGFHVFLFFSDPVPAWKARAVVFALLGEAGVIGDDDELSTFDRLFPNQDKLSGKKLGNLISLPFQWMAGQKGNTLFLNPETDYKNPYQDQWDTLKNIEKISESDLDLLIKEWDLKQEVPKRSQSDFKPIHENQQLAVFSRIKNGCKFIKHCCDDSETLSEPEWYALLSIITRCKDGRRQAHKFSEDHPAYNYEDTENKIEHALNDTGPYRCQTIAKEINPKYCGNCAFRIKESSPIRISDDALNDDSIRKIIEDLNKVHAIIMLGGKCLILTEIIEPVFKRPDFILSSTHDFRTRYSNKKIPDPKNPDKDISVGELWLSAQQRREHLGGIIFDPSAAPDPQYYNLWKGFAVRPKEGDWSLFREHIYKVICSGKKARCKWVVSWIARIMQAPGGERPGTSIVMRGKEGTGKGVFVNTIGRMFGKHFIQIAQTSQVTGRFNHHFKDVILGFVDEGFFAGDKQAAGTLRNLITEPFLTVEQKGRDIIRVKNNVSLIMASNADWIIPAGMEDRRFLFLDVSADRMQDKPYFKAIMDQMTNGGIEAMLFDLLQMDISGVDLRSAEQTDGLFEQKLYSMTTVQKYWFHRLMDGRLISSDSGQYSDSFGWNVNIKLTDQYKNYLAYAESLHDHYPICEELFGKTIIKMCEGVKKTRPTFNGQRVNMRSFPPLDKCRKEFEKLVKTTLDWGDWEDQDEDIF